MLAKVGNLTDNANGRVVFCPYCEAEYSATKGDYFWASDNDTLDCPEHGPMVIVTKRIVYEEEDESRS